MHTGLYVSFLITVTISHDTEEYGDNGTHQVASDNTGKAALFLSPLNPANSQASEGTINKQKAYKTPEIPTRIATKSQRDKLISTPRNSEGDIGEANGGVRKKPWSTETIGRKSPCTVKDDIKECFGFEDSSSQSDVDEINGANPDITCNSTVEVLAGISPVRRASILPQKGKLGGHFPGFAQFNVSTASLTSPAQPKAIEISPEAQKILPEESNFLAPKPLTSLSVRPSRFTATKPKASRIPPSVSLLPHSSSLLSPKTLLPNNRILGQSISNDPKQRECKEASTSENTTDCNLNK